MSIVNPAFVVKNWGTGSVEITVDGKKVEDEKDVRVGYETTHSGTDMILWFNIKSKESVEFKLVPKN